MGTHCSSALQEAAAGVLHNLAAFNTDNKVKVAAAGAIPPLVAMLGAPSMAGAQEMAALALGQLAMDPENHVSIKSDSRSLSSLSELQRTSDSAAVRRAAEWALQIMMHAPPVARSIRSDETVAAEEEGAVTIAAELNNKTAEKMASIIVAKAAPPAAHPTEAGGPSQREGPSQQAGPSASASSPVAATSSATIPRLKKSCWSCGATGVPLKKCSGRVRRRNVLWRGLPEGRLEGAQGEVHRAQGRRYR